MYIQIHIHVYCHPPPTTRTPFKHTVNTDTNAVFFSNPILELFLQIENTSVKHKNPKIPKSKTLYIYGILQIFLIFGFLECWILDACILDPCDICAPGTAYMRTG